MSANTPRPRGILLELWAFLRVRKKYWLAPIILALVLLMGLIVAAAQSSIVSPFIYAFF